jgi:hypothetical protein
MKTPTNIGATADGAGAEHREHRRDGREEDDAVAAVRDEHEEGERGQDDEDGHGRRSYHPRFNPGAFLTLRFPGVRDKLIVVESNVPAGPRSEDQAPPPPARKPFLKPLLFWMFCFMLPATLSVGTLGVYIHEFSHGLTALATGGHFLGIKMQPSTRRESTMAYADAWSATIRIWWCWPGSRSTWSWVCSSFDRPSVAKGSCRACCCSSAPHVFSRRAGVCGGGMPFLGIRLR